MVQDGMFHPPMISGGSRVAPSPATSAHEEHDSTSSLSWPSTPVSQIVDIIPSMSPRSQSKAECQGPAILAKVFRGPKKHFSCPECTFYVLHSHVCSNLLLMS